MFKVIFFKENYFKISQLLMVKRCFVSKFLMPFNISKIISVFQT